MVRLNFSYYFPDLHLQLYTRLPYQAIYIICLSALVT